MLVGLVIIAAGLYLLVLGIGAPIEIRTFEVGQFKASLEGVGAGAGVALVGCVVLWLPMHFMKRETTSKTSVFDSTGLLRRLTETTLKQFHRP
jgi:hypothetical protein